MWRAVALSLIGCAAPSEGPCEPAAHRDPVGTAQNVVVVLVDDLGTDRFTSYADVQWPLPLPTFDRLADQGLQFDAAYSDPTCSPTRASLLTGRRPSRHGVGKFIDARDRDEEGLPHAEITLPERLRDAPTPWSSAVIGKWHLERFADRRAPFGPLDQGFDHHRGTAANPESAVTDLPGPFDYSRYEYLEDGVASLQTGYLTTRTTDDAIAAVEELPEPYFLYVPYNAVHSPYHLPPTDLLRLPVPDRPTEAELADLMLDALDHELGRLVDAIDLTDTLLLVLADNGTPKAAQHELGGGHKASVREGGVHVPFWALGAGVEAAGRSPALVYVADVFATVADLAGVDPTGGGEVLIDGRSLLPLFQDPDAPFRRCLVTEKFEVNGHPDRGRDASIRDGRWMVEDRSGRRAVLRDVAADRRGEASEVARSDWSDAQRDTWHQLRRWLREDDRVVK